jgi:hypothetical protein
VLNKSQQKERERTFFTPPQSCSQGNDRLNIQPPWYIVSLLRYCTRNDTNLWFSRLNCPELVFTIATLRVLLDLEMSQWWLLTSGHGR